MSGDAESLMSELLARLEQQKVEAEEREKMIQLRKTQVRRLLAGILLVRPGAGLLG